MDKKKIVKISIVSVLFVAAVVFFILFAVQVTKTNKTDISVNHEIKITSRVENAAMQTYKSTITGAVKNNTNKAMNNVVILIDVKTKTLGHAGSLEINIETLEAGGIYTINKVFDTNENFEKVKKISYRVGNGNYIAMPNEGEISFNGWSILYLIPGLMLLGGGIACTKNFFFKKETSSNLRVSPKISRKSNEEMLGEIITNQQALEKERIALEKERIAKEQQQAELDKPVYCQYCGAKNSSKDSKCKGCGGSLK